MSGLEGRRVSVSGVVERVLDGPQRTAIVKLDPAAKRDPRSIGYRLSQTITVPVAELEVKP